MASYVENANRVKNANDAIKQAIINKGVTPTGNLESYAEAISQISTGGGGTDVSDTTAIEEDVLVGKVFHKANGSRVEGSMPNNGAVSKTLDATTTSYTVPEGYHNGSGSVAISTQTKSVSPSTSQQTVYPDAEKVLSAVTVSGIPTQTKSVTPSESQQTVYPDAGYFLSAVTVGAASTAKVKIGTFTTSTGGNTIECRFTPKWVIISSAYNGTTSGAFTNTETEIWNEGGGYFEYYTAASATNGTRTSNRIVVGVGHFTHIARYNNKPAYYIAIG